MCIINTSGVLNGSVYRSEAPNSIRQCGFGCLQQVPKSSRETRSAYTLAAERRIDKCMGRLEEEVDLLIEGAEALQRSGA